METTSIVTEETINELLDNGLVDSAEYWASLWICEKGIAPSELAKRHYVYGICLQRSGRVSQAKYSFETALSLTADGESSVSKSDLLFHLYECEYESTEDKEDRSALRSCIYILEGIPPRDRSPKVLSALAKLYWSCNNYELAKTTCLELLKIQPLAMEAVTILSRLNDFKGMKTETQLPPDSLSPLQSSLKQAEYCQLQQPARSIQLFRTALSSLNPSPLLHQRIARCFFAMHQMKDAVAWFDIMQQSDAMNRFETDVALSVVLSRVYNVPRSNPLTDSQPTSQSLLSILSQPSPNATACEQTLHIYSQRTPFALPLLLLRCFLSSHQDLMAVESCYWNVINYYPSYASYMLLISYYLDESMMVKAMTLARQIHKANGDSFYANLILAKTALLAGDSMKMAETALRKCYNENPSHYEVCYLLAKVSMDQKEYDKAIRILKPILSPDLPSEIKQLLAQCYLKKGEMIPFLQIQHSLE